MIACDNGHIDVVTILLENMANIEATDEVGGFVLKDGLVHWNRTADIFCKGSIDLF
jgi:hypothetical protein